jgi:hypothetical protein
MGLRFRNGALDGALSTGLVLSCAIQKSVYSAAAVEYEGGYDGRSASD